MSGICVATRPENRPGPEGELGIETIILNTGREASWAGRVPTRPVTIPPNRDFPADGLESTPSPNFPVGARLLPAPTKSKRTPAPPVARSQEDKPGHGLWARPLQAAGQRGRGEVVEPHPNRQKQTPLRPQCVPPPLWPQIPLRLPTCQSVPRGQKSVPRCRTPYPCRGSECPGL